MRRVTQHCRPMLVLKNHLKRIPSDPAIKSLGAFFHGLLGDVDFIGLHRRFLGRTKDWPRPVSVGDWRCRFSFDGWYCAQCRVSSRIRVGLSLSRALIKSGVTRHDSLPRGLPPRVCSHSLPVSHSSIHAAPPALQACSFMEGAASGVWPVEHGQWT